MLIRDVSTPTWLSAIVRILLLALFTTIITLMTASLVGRYLIVSAETTRGFAAFGAVCVLSALAAWAIREWQIAAILAAVGYAVFSFGRMHADSTVSANMMFVLMLIALMLTFILNAICIELRQLAEEEKEEARARKRVRT